MLKGKKVMTGKKAVFPKIQLKESYLLLLAHLQMNFRMVRRNSISKVVLISPT